MKKEKQSFFQRKEEDNQMQNCILCCMFSRGRRGRSGWKEERLGGGMERQKDFYEMSRKFSSPFSSGQCSSPVARPRSLIRVRLPCCCFALVLRRSPPKNKLASLQILSTCRPNPAPIGYQGNVVIAPLKSVRGLSLCHQNGCEDRLTTYFLCSTAVRFLATLCGDVLSPRASYRYTKLTM